MRVARILLVCSAVAISIPLVGGAARACSCLPGDPRANLLAADAAAVVVAREAPSGLSPFGDQRVTWSFEVREALKGELGEEIEVVTSGSSASCGLGGLEFGLEYGLFLHRQDSNWTSGLCSQIDPDTLRRAAQPLAKPDGSGRAAFIVAGVFGEARTLALDSKLRTLHYGFGKGEALRVATCPGGHTAVELVRTEARPDPYVIGVRNLGSFVLEREVRIRDLDEPEGYGLLNFHAMRCRDPTATDVVVVASKGAREQATGFVLSVGSSGQRTLWEGKALAGVFSKDGHRAFIIDGLRRLSEIDLASGQARQIRTVREEPDYELHLSPDGDRLAWHATIGGARGFLCVVEIDSAAQRTIAADAGDVGWTPDGRILFAGGSAEHVDVRLFDANLTPATSWRGWEPEGSLIVAGDRVYGYGNGRIQVASVENGQPRIARRFDGYIQNDLVAVLAAHAGRASAREGIPVWGVAAALFALVGVSGAAAARRLKS